MAKIHNSSITIQLPNHSHWKYNNNQFIIKIKCILAILIISMFITPSSGQCPSLRPPPYGYIIRPCGSSAGDNCNIDCDIGFDIIGPSYRLCRRNGSWSGTDTQCVKPSIQCPLIRASQSNVQVRGCQNIAGGFCEFGCHHGWTMEGPRRIYCRVDGRWSSEPPICRTEACSSPPPAPENGAFIGECSHQIGSYCSYRCSPGYTIIGSPTIHCTSSGHWSPPLAPVCQRLARSASCPPLFPPENGSISGKCGPVAVTDEECKFSCDSGHKINGEETLKCQSDGKWSASIPTCSQNQCPAINPPIGTITAGQCNPGLPTNSCLIYCASGSSVISGATTMTCGEDGNWTGSIPSCAPSLSHQIIVNHCPSLVAPVNGLATGHCSPGLTNRFCSFACASGYTLIGSRSIQCLSNGQWSASVPLCSRLTSSNPSSLITSASSSFSCPELNVPVGGFYKSNLHCPRCPNLCPGQPNQACSLFCGRGYQLSGRAQTSVCNPNTLRWDPEPATCVGENLFMPFRTSITS